MVKLRNTVFIVVGLLLLVVLTMFFRQSTHNTNTVYENYDATYHVLLTVEALKQTPLSQHRMLPIVSLGDTFDKHIQWGATLPDKYGNYYYTSFPPAGFAAPFVFFSLFDLDVTVNNLLLFSTLVLGCSVILFFLLTRTIAKNYSNNSNPNAPAILASIVYLFSMETLYSHGYIYWGHSLMQPLYLAFLYIVFNFFSKQEMRLPTVLVFMFSFLLCYIEWSGYLIVIGAMVAFGVSKITRDKKNKLIVACAAGAILAFFLFILVFILTIDVAEFFSILNRRFSARNFTQDVSLLDLMWGYYRSYYLFLILIPMGLFYFYKRRDICSDKKDAVVLIGIVILFGMLENIVMKQHAVEYNFDRLKFLPLFSLAIPVIWAASNFYRKMVVVFIILTASVISLYLYPTTRVTHDASLTQNKEFVEKGDFDRACSSCILGMEPRVRGYANLLLDSGIYEEQSVESIVELAEKLGKCACYIEAKDIGSSMIRVEGFKRYE